jgi:hypothetical protein
MAYIECKIWPFSNDISYQEACYKAEKVEYFPHTVKALIDTSSTANKISKSLIDKLGIKYIKYTESCKYNEFYVLGYIEKLYISFRYKGKDKLISYNNDVFNRFLVVKDYKTDLTFGIDWLGLHNAKIDIIKKEMKIDGNSIPFRIKVSFVIPDSKTDS